MSAVICIFCRQFVDLDTVKNSPSRRGSSCNNAQTVCRGTALAVKQCHRLSIKQLFCHRLRHKHNTHIPDRFDQQIAGVDIRAHRRLPALVRKHKISRVLCPQPGTLSDARKKHDQHCADADANQYAPKKRCHNPARRQRRGIDCACKYECCHIKSADVAGQIFAAAHIKSHHAHQKTNCYLDREGGDLTHSRNACVYTAQSRRACEPAPLLLCLRHDRCKQNNESIDDKVIKENKLNIYFVQPHKTPFL